MVQSCDTAAPALFQYGLGAADGLRLLVFFLIVVGDKQGVDREQMPSVRSSLLLLAGSVVRRALPCNSLCLSGVFGC